MHINRQAVYICFMNSYRYDEEKRKQWVKDKITRAKTVKQICREAVISRATLYNWIDEFKHLEREFSSKYDASEAAKPIQKTAKPELLNRASPETAERYRMLVTAIAGLDTHKNFSKRLVAVLIKRFTLTVPQACAVVGIDEEVYGYKPRKPEVEDYIVYEALVNLIREDRTRDFENCYNILLQQNPDWTRKQIKRVYRDGMVYLERKRANTRWEKAGKAKNAQQQALPEILQPLDKGRIQKPGGTWNLGLLEYTSELDGNKEAWWMLCILDEESNTPLNAVMGFGTIHTEAVLSFLDKAASENGIPRKLKVPGKTVLTARELTRWVWQHKMALHTFSLNKPENLEATEKMENEILLQLNAANISTKAGLQQAVACWIGKMEYA